MSTDKDSRRLLLLRVRTARVPAPPRCQLCQYGPPDDRSYKVSGFIRRKMEGNRKKKRMSHNFHRLFNSKK